MKKQYTYYIVIQQFWGKWYDVDFYKTNSLKLMDKETRQSFKENLKLYRTEQTAPVRVIFRKEKNI